MEEIVTARDICRMIIAALRMCDKRLICHGIRVGYIVSKMMEVRGGYEDYERAEYAFLATIHDIGAFKVEAGKDMLNFDVAHPMPHSIYGYLFMKYVSPIGDRSKVFLYSHIDYQKLPKVKFDGMEVAQFIYAAGRFDLFHNALGSKFTSARLRDHEGKKFSRMTLDVLDLALKKYDILDKFSEGEDAFKPELEDLFGKLIFNEEEKKMFIKLLVYISGFKDTSGVVSTISSMIIAEEIAQKIGEFSEEEVEYLYYGALLHDIGMASVPREIAEATRKLTEDELTIYQRHVLIAEFILKDCVHPEVVKLVSTHHERLDGSGYPNHLEAPDTDLLAKVLQLADRASILTSDRPFRKAKGKEATINIITDEMNHNKFNRKVVMAFINNYDEIMAKVDEKGKEALDMFYKLQEQYEKVKATLMPNG